MRARVMVGSGLKIECGFTFHVVLSFMRVRPRVGLPFFHCEMFPPTNPNALAVLSLKSLQYPHLTQMNTPTLLNNNLGFLFELLLENCILFSRLFVCFSIVGSF
ncbi:Hypothetical protein, putative [Bodo saltans]|uniref:Uncharacterized protein n=1 Tax=Bodo saltans TaxID=75058 RepID=A0A0S4IH62_BODSA|nr:Hypothetical protein, putative [Bodo saltans]|eukprot:CUE58732.1 Hypothetical protein, putative [Bodo saltans]